MMRKINACYILVFVALLFSNNTFGKKKDVIVIHKPSVSLSEKEAILILPGLGDSKKGREKQLEFFGQLEYDLYIPNFIDRKSVDASLKKFKTFYHTHNLNQYKKIHVFSYILGTWVINKFILENGVLNISSIVYDRSPLQERAPIVLVENIPFIARLVKGKIVEDISKIDYPKIPKSAIKIGLLVESKATKLITRFKKETIQKGDVHWNNYDFNQERDDLIFTPLNHDQMYLHFEVIGQDILSFFKNGHFLLSSQRDWYGWDPFLKWDFN